MPLIKLLVEGGKMSPGPAVAQQLGPMGINMGKVISDVNEATSEFKGITVPVHLNVDAKTKEFTIKVLSPPTSELIKKELGLEKASGERLKLRVGNMAIEQVIAVSKTKHASMLSNDFLATVKSIIGTCQALGVLIENKESKEILEEIAEGKYKTEIESQKTDIDPEKRKELDAYFTEVADKQAAIQKAEAEEKAAEEEAKAAEATAAPAEGEEAPEEEKKE
ncbi:50S ribosomal protein L11 [archaeon]|jgi:large subunit ribosomal protein L11|nr:50S ribosomal protein L11 [archaeon]MBT3578218.1 50S ribosomal protein L11 [archaeon]MBT6819861.1 50S ribosomal protein L11 [archaeon]MBT6956579.1 50S ribosomal protein L11 [archaeon]MBT7025643.1 50S ribosomal protein L11 [archaeon]